MDKRKTLILILGLAVFMGLGTSTMVVNSQDWKDNSLVISYSHFQDEDVRMVTSLGEGQLIADMLEDNQTHQVYSSPDNAVWDEYGQFLSNKDVDVETNTVNWEEDQYSYYSDVSDEVEGFIVIEPGYGFDTISAFSKITGSDYWPIYYQGDRTKEFLSGKDKHVTFYGEYYDQPWLDLDTETEVVSTGTKSGNNKYLTENLLEESNGSSVVLAGDSYIEKGFLKKGTPIVLSQDLESTVDLVNKHNISIVEVIGAENVNFGNSIKDRLGDSVSVIAKFGRKFTGVEGLQGTYPIKKLPVDAVERDITLERVDVDSSDDTSDQVRLLFSNNGNIPTNLDFSAIQLSNSDETELVSRPTEMVLRPEVNTSLSFDVNLSFEPSEAEVSFDYTGKEGLTTQEYDVNTLEIKESGSVNLERLYYSEPNQEIIMSIMNGGKETKWVGGQLDNLEILNRSEKVLSQERVRIGGGETGKLVYNVRLTENQTVENSMLNATLVSGDERNQTDGHTNIQNMRLEVEKTSITGAFMRNPAPVAVVVVMAVLLLLEWRRGLVSGSVSRIKQRYW